MYKKTNTVHVSVRFSAVEKTGGLHLLTYLRSLSI